MDAGREFFVPFRDCKSSGTNYKEPILNYYLNIGYSLSEPIKVKRAEHTYIGQVCI